jgi:hypothetical protein
MALLNRTLVFANQRLSLRNYQNLENFVAGDLNAILKNIVTTTPMIVKGFQIFDSATTNTVVFPSLDIYIQLNGSMVISSSETTGSYLYLGITTDGTSNGREKMTLNPSTTYYLEIGLGTEDINPNLEVFWNNSSTSEYTNLVSTATRTNSTIYATTGSFTAGRVPIAKIITGPAAVTSVEDFRPLLFRLSNEDPYSAQYIYPWSQGRAEGDTNIITSAAQYQVGDKGIMDLKSWMNAVMSEIYRIKFGSSPAALKYWFTPNTTSLSELDNSPIASCTGTFSWSTGTNVITATQPITLYFPGTAITNTILAAAWAAPATLAADGDLYYITLNPASSGNLSLTKSTIGTYTDADNRIIIAVRTGNSVIITFPGTAMINLANGESAPLISELTDQTLTFIGATNAADYQPQYVNNNYVSDNSALNTAISDLDGAVMKNTHQDRNAWLVAGGDWSWNLATSTLTWSANAYIQVPGLADNVNRILAASYASIAADECLYVTVKRTAGASDLTVNKAAISAVVDNKDYLIIARRVVDSVIVGKSILLNDGDSFTLYAGGGGGGSTKKISQAHTFTVGKVIYFNTTWQLADNSTLGKEGIGIVSKVIDANNFVVTFSGYISGLAGLSANSYYYVTSAGALSTTNSQYSAPIGMAISATELIMIPWKPEIPKTFGLACKNDPGQNMKVESGVTNIIPILNSSVTITVEAGGTLIARSVVGATIVGPGDLVGW